MEWIPNEKDRKIILDAIHKIDSLFFFWFGLMRQSKEKEENDNDMCDLSHLIPYIYL
jgi:hypothetical protein